MRSKRGASGPAGVYAIVEKVIFEPSEAAPERIQVWGVFAISDGQPGAGYLPPQRGFMYFGLPPSQEVQIRLGVRQGSVQAALSEWSDLKKVAGTGTPVAFAERSSWKGRIRKSTDKPEGPDLYPVFSGITRLGTPNNPAVIAQLRAAVKAR